MKVSDYIVERLATSGVRNVFLLPGGACMHLADSIGRHPKLEYVCCLHEQACAFAAEAYAEFSGQLGCVLVTAGPGGTNAVTGVACAWLESSSVLFLSGQAKRADLLTSREIPVRSMGQQELDIVSVVRPITKFAKTVLDPLSIREDLEKAIHLATTGRKGPVWLDIPLDVQAAQVDPALLAPYVTPIDAKPDYSAVLRAIFASLSAAKRPVIYAGNGVRVQTKAFEALATKLGIPVLLSWKAIDILPDSSSVAIGRPGGIGQRAANIVQQKADWMLVLGARLDLPSLAFNYPGFAPQAHKIIVDVDPAELAKFNPQPQLPVTADLNTFLPALLDAVESRSDATSSYSSWLTWSKRLVEKFPVVQAEHSALSQNYVSTYLLIDALSDLTEATDIMVPGSSGPCSDIFMQAFRVKRGQRVVNAPGLGAMGTGLPGTLGVCLAGGRRRVINVNGDGGFQLNVQELETVRRLNLPIKFFILDNGGYRSIVAMQRNHFQGRLVGSDPSSHLTLPDMRKIGAAYGLPVTSADCGSNLRQVIVDTLNTRGPTICVVKTSVDEKTEPRVASELRPDGTFLMRPMEDMNPLLTRIELKSLMDEQAQYGH